MNPFHPFNPPTSAHFIDRVIEQQRLLDNIRQGVSSAIIGSPHIGKTSLLKQISTLKWFRKNGLDPERYIIVPLSLELFLSHETHQDFWRRLCQRAIKSNPSLRDDFIPLLSNNNFDNYSLYDAFGNVGDRGLRVIAFVDEFDKLLDRPHLSTQDFTSPIRYIATNTNGLSFVITNRLSLSELQDRMPSFGSPFVNFLDSVNLSGFDTSTIESWLRSSLPEELIREVILLAGHHPFLLHLAGELLWNVKDKPAKQWYAQRDIFIDRATPHFNDVWKYLSPKSQLAIVIIALQRLEEQLAHKSFYIENMERTLLWLSNEVNELGYRAVLEKNDDGNWTIGSIGFLFWLIENKVADAMTRDFPTHEWLHDKQFKLAGLMTEEEIQFTQKVLKSIPTDIISLTKKAFLPKYLQ